jgi:hypothetical protein
MMSVGDASNCMRTHSWWRVHRFHSVTFSFRGSEAELGASRVSARMQWSLPRVAMMPGNQLVAREVPTMAMV